MQQSFAQTIDSNSIYRGIWYYALSSSPTDIGNTLDSLKSQGVTIKGVVIVIPWWKFQQTAPASQPKYPYEDHSTDASYTWTANFDSYMKAVYDKDTTLYIGLLIFTASDAPIGVVKTNTTSCNRGFGSGRPDWLTSTPFHDSTRDPAVHAFYTNISGSDAYPDYFGNYDTGTIISGQSRYESFWSQMLRDMLSHVKHSTLAQLGWNKSKLLFFQSCEGKSGDSEPSLEDTCFSQYGYHISDIDWFGFQTKWWSNENKIISDSIPTVHLMVNTGITDKLYGIAKNGGTTYTDLDHDCINNIGSITLPRDTANYYSLFNYASKLNPKPWLKATNMGHWFQQNFETKFRYAFDSVKAANRNAAHTKYNVLIRDELDFPGKALSFDPFILFPIAASALKSGLDMWMIDFNTLIANDADHIIDAPVKEGLRFFNTHVNSYRPLDTGISAKPNSAFCYIRKGLDASSTEFSPANGFNCTISLLPKAYVKGNCGDTIPPCVDSGLFRTKCIADHYNPTHLANNVWNPDVPECKISKNNPDSNGRNIAQGSPFTQFSKASNYDVGWYTHRDEYSVNLKLLESDKAHSTPYWNYRQDTSLYGKSTQGKFALGVSNNNADTNDNKLNFIVKNFALTSGSNCIKMVINFFNPPDVTGCDWEWDLRYTTQAGAKTYKVTKSGHTLHNRWDTAMKIISNPAFDITDNNPDFYIENINELCTATIIKFSTIEFYQNACGGLAPEKPEKQESKMLDEPLSEKLIVIPNPAVNMFTVETENKSPLKEVRIFDKSSRLVFYKQCAGVSLQVTKAQLNNLPGMYYIQTLTQGNKTLSQKLIIE